ncbi:hypothetical protein BK709_30405 [Bacillus thuringiensis serovar shandongiensis]|uniref:hypothetical protein n=1 Tax=Bacillus toyonensis TaxID=155322 RepID=UPI000B449C1C|nr:hypothetical protein [Bacillus toyonensis]MEC2394894.1 hypothetical protein [Bacillus toyonensis]OTX38306.1 hypothetical protein BK717_09365 [Bacillus thuringiensis serovar malayensis]OUB01373.1 hypothetical protein BK709_30405 [Bacillus thuringiensis serovar shandongiensis]
MEKNIINLNSILANMLAQYERTQQIMTFSFEKIDNDFFFIDIDSSLLEEIQLSPNDIINKRLQDICINSKIADALYIFHQLAWTNQPSSLHTVNLNDTFYIIYFKLIENEKKVVKGYCVPICSNEELLLTRNMPTFSRSDFIVK